MGAFEEREYGVYGFRIGDKQSYFRSSMLKDKVEIITDGYGKLLSVTNRDLLLRLKTPSDIGDIQILEIGENAFSGCENLVNLDISEPVEEIGKSAFEGCLGLRGLSLPDSLYFIGKAAFRNCPRLESVKLPSSLEELGAESFSNCISLRHVSFPNREIKLGPMCFSSCISLESISIHNTKEIPNGAFMGSGIKSIELPATVERIGAGVFSRCECLKSIYFNGSLERFKEIDFEAYWNRGLKKDVELFVRERGKWINVFESREQGTVSRVDKAISTLSLEGVELTKSNVARAFREKSRRFHPDIIAPYGLDKEFSIFASEKFRELKDAYEILLEVAKMG